jgi:hypothetical protein
LIWFIVISVPFSNISAISWRPVSVVEEAGVPGENHRPWQATGQLYHLRLQVKCTLLCNLQSRASGLGCTLLSGFLTLGYYCQYKVLL